MKTKGAVAAGRRSGALLEESDAGDDLARVRQALAQMAAIGGDAAWLAGILAERVTALPNERRRRRDGAIVALAATFPGTRWQVADQVATALRRYEAATWKRRDRALAAPPLEYLTQPDKLAMFEIMRESAGRGALGAKRISQVLASHCSNEAISGNGDPLSISVALPLDLRPLPENRPENAMNAIALRDDRQFIAALRESPVGAKILETDSAREIAERERLAAALARVEEEAGAAFLQHEKLVSEAIAEVRKAEAALRAANAKLTAASHAKQAALLALTAERERLELRLRAGADAEAIDAFVGEMRIEGEAAMKLHQGGYTQIQSPVTRIRYLRGYTNKHDVQARVAACRTAIEKAERLRLEPDQRQVRARLAALRASLPAVGPPIEAPLPREGER